MDKRGLSISSMVLGIVACTFCCNALIAIPCGVLAIVFGTIQLKKNKDNMAKTGLITGIVGLSIPGIIILGSLISFIVSFCLAF